MLTKQIFLTILILALTVFAFGQAASDSTKFASPSASQNKSFDDTPDGFEVRQTEKLLGVPLQTREIEQESNETLFVSATSVNARTFIIRTVYQDSRE